MKKLIFSIGLFLLTIFCFAQNTGSLEKQWESMLAKSNNYQEYKVVKKNELNQFWTRVQDSLLQSQGQLALENRKIKDQNIQILKLKKKVAEIEYELEKVSMNKDNITFMGSAVNKHTYVYLLWFIIFLIIAGCGALFILFKNSNSVTVQKKNEYDHLSKSFEEFKMSKIELERKLRRELQTNVNMIEELKRHGRI